MKQKNLGNTWYYLLLIAIVLVAVVAAPLSAKYIKQTENLTNIFTPADSEEHSFEDPTVIEDFDGHVKENVYIKVGDTGVPVYVRVEISITWKNAEGTVYYLTPAPGVDYSLDLDLTGDWELGEDGYYYYKIPVESDGETSILIKKCTQTAVAPEGYSLSVDILVQTVQANDSDSSYKEAWELS